MMDIVRSTGNDWRYARSRVDIKPSAEIKKCLFGEPDHESLQSDLREQFREIRQADELKWNYDFSHDMPLPGGRYKWEKVSADINANITEPTPTVTDSTSPSTSTTSPHTFSAKVVASCLDSPSVQRSISGKTSHSYSHSYSNTIVRDL